MFPVCPVISSSPVQRCAFYIQYLSQPAPVLCTVFTAACALYTVQCNLFTCAAAALKHTSIHQSANALKWTSVKCTAAAQLHRSGAFQPKPNTVLIAHPCSTIRCIWHWQMKEPAPPIHKRAWKQRATFKFNGQIKERVLTYQGQAVCRQGLIIIIIERQQCSLVSCSTLGSL